MAKMGLPWKLQVCQTTPVCTLLIFSPIGSQTPVYHINYVQLYETLHLEMAAHFQKVTETGQSLKQQKFEGVGYCLVPSVNLVSLVLSFCFTGFAQT